MRIRRLVLQNYRRHRNTSIELPDGLISLVGRNGSGKSSLLEAIAFALYGTAATRTAKDLLRSEHAAPGDPVRVAIEAEVDGQAWHVVRELRGKNLSALASLEVDGHVVVAPQAGSSDAVSREVESRIGLSRDAFFTTVFSEQKQLGRLAHQKPADRKRLILSMMGVDALDRAIQAGRRRRNEAQVRAQTLQRELPDVPALEAQATQEAREQTEAGTRVDGCTTAWEAAKVHLQACMDELQQAAQAQQARQEAQQAVQSAATTRQQAVAALEDIMERSSRAAKAHDEAARLAHAPENLAACRTALEKALEQSRLYEQARELDQQIQRLQAESKALVLPGPNGLLETAQQAVVDLRRRREGAGSLVAVASAQARQSRDRLRRLSSLDETTDCPVCERPLDGHLGDLHARFEEDLVAQEQAVTARQQEMAAMDVALQGAEKHLHEMEAQAKRHEQAVAARQRVERDLQQALARRQGLPDGAPDLVPLRKAVAQAEQEDQQRVRSLALAEDLPSLQVRHDAAQKHLEAASAALAAAQEALQAMPETAARLDAAQKACNDATAAERAAERDLHQAQAALAAAAVRCDATRSRLDDARQRRLRLREANAESEHWELLAGSGGLLDRFRTHLVGRIGPAVSAEASRLLASFTGGRYDELVLDDEYQIFVGDGGVLYDVSRFSGGETDLVHLALRLAVSRMLLERAGVEIRLLCLDEVFGSLDDERRLLVLGALQELGGLYSQVFVVSHHDALRDALDHAIVVDEHDGEASIRMHNG